MKVWLKVLIILFVFAIETKAQKIPLIDLGIWKTTAELPPHLADMQEYKSGKLIKGCPYLHKEILNVNISLHSGKDYNNIKAVYNLFDNSLHVIEDKKLIDITDSVAAFEIIRAGTKVLSEKYISFSNKGLKDIKGFVRILNKGLRYDAFGYAVNELIVNPMAAHGLVEYVYQTKYKIIVFNKATKTTESFNPKFAQFTKLFADKKQQIYTFFDGKSFETMILSDYADFFSNIDV